MRSSPARRSLAFVCLSLLLAPPHLAAREQDHLARGIVQIQEGAFEEALVTLDLATRDLKDKPSRVHDLALAYVYLGQAYLGLNQENLAQAKLMKAIETEPRLTLDPQQFPRNVQRALEDARKEYQQRTSLERQAKRKRGKTGLIVLGAGGLAAVGIGLAVVPKKEERANRPPTASFAIAPEGQALLDATRVIFTASVSDPDGEPVSAAWDFGDSSSAEGLNVTHVYQREGTFSVVLTARDGLTSTTANGSVTVRSLTGSWRPASAACETEVEYVIKQGSGGALALGVTYGKSDARTELVSNAGRVEDPRAARFSYVEFMPSTGRNYCAARFAGVVDGAGAQIVGTLTYESGYSCSCSGRQSSLTLVRQ